LQIFKFIIIGVLSIALIVSVVFVLKGARDYFATAQQPAPAKAAPKPSVDVSKFLNFLDEKPTPSPVKNNTNRTENRTRTNVDQALDDLVDANVLKLWGYVDGFQKACQFPKQLDQEAFINKFPRNIFKEWFGLYGKDFADSQDAFEKAIFSNATAIQFGKENPRISVLMISLNWHEREWEKEVRKAKVLEQSEERRVAAFTAAENARVLLVRTGAVSSFMTALTAFGVFMVLALLLIFSKIETDLMEIRDLMKTKGKY
jgi:hypothetical protein